MLVFNLRLCVSSALLMRSGAAAWGLGIEVALGSSTVKASVSLHGSSLSEN